MHMKKRWLSLLTAVSLCIPTLLFSGCKNQNGVTEQGFYLDTVISITLYSNDAEEQIHSCFDLAEKYENYFSNTISDSDISKINESNGTPVEVHDETIELLNSGIYYSELSGGSFDITVGALSNLWDFDNNTGNIPNDSDIQAALKTVDYKKIQIDGNTVTYTGNGILDLGGIAKGYIADKMKEYLNREGIYEGLINLGGNVLCVGPKDSDDGYYTIGLQKPFSDDGSVIASVKVSDQSVVTSGTYQRYFEKDGEIYHHILDLTTGYPIDNHLSSVTIITDSSVDADALSTTVFTMGEDAGKQFVESLDQVEAIFITDNNKVSYTSGIGTSIPFEMAE
jgi:thiamine biosynthesis lipoprotein